MSTYTVHPDGLFDIRVPVLASVALETRDNLLAIAEGTTGAPINRPAWHPYDMDNAGTGTGLIYDHATDGSATTITSPTFDPDYEYLIRITGLDHGASGDQGITLSLEKGGSFQAISSPSFVASPRQVYYGNFIIPAAGVSGRVFGFNGYPAVVAYDGSSTVIIVAGQDVEYDSPTEEVTRFRIVGDSAFDGGAIRMYKRRFFDNA